MAPNQIARFNLKVMPSPANMMGAHTKKGRKPIPFTVAMLTRQSKFPAAGLTNISVVSPPPFFHGMTR
jgi:hypothetical protein